MNFIKKYHVIAVFGILLCVRGLLFLIAKHSLTMKIYKYEGRISRNKPAPP